MSRRGTSKKKKKKIVFFFAIYICSKYLADRMMSRNFLNYTYVGLCSGQSEKINKINLYIKENEINEDRYEECAHQQLIVEDGCNNIFVRDLLLLLRCFLLLPLIHFLCISRYLMCRIYLSRIHVAICYIEFGKSV